MTGTTALFLIASVWLFIGIVSSFVMARRGHDPWAWAVLGSLLGPIVVPLALASGRRERILPRVARTLDEGRSGSGPVSVLVGVDGSSEALLAAERVVALLGARLGLLTLATVIDYDAATSASAPDDVFVREAHKLLDRVAASIPGVAPRTVVLVGRPADALLEYAAGEEADLVAVGARGRGLSEAVLGSVAAHLIRRRRTPILVA